MGRLRNLFIDIMLYVFVLLGLCAVLGGLTDNMALFTIFGIAALAVLGWLVFYLCLFEGLTWVVKFIWKIIKW